MVARDQIALVPSGKARNQPTKVEMAQGGLATVGLLIRGIAAYGEKECVLKKENAAKARFAGDVCLALATAPTVYRTVMNRESLFTKIASALIGRKTPELPDAEFAIV